MVGVRVFVQAANKGATTSVWAWAQAPSNTKFDVKSPFWVAPTRGLNGYTNGAACVKKDGPEGQATELGSMWDHQCICRTGIVPSILCDEERVVYEFCCGDETR